MPAPAASSSPNLRQVGIYVVTNVTLDGATLFTIAAVANAAPSQLSLEQRLTDIQSALAEVVATNADAKQATEYDPRTLRIHIKHEPDVASLEAVDARHPDPLPIVTVTTSDARYNGASIDDLATQWRADLQSALTRALELRQPAVQKRSLAAVVRVTAGLALGTLLVLPAFTTLRRRIFALATEVEERERTAQAEGAVSDAGTPDAGQRRRRFLALAVGSLQPVQRLHLYRAVAESLLWLLALAWATAAIWAFSLFPQTTPFSRAFVHGAGIVAGIAIATGLLNRLLDVVIARVASAWQWRTFGRSEERARYLLRIPTIVSAIGGFKAFVLVFVAVLAMLNGIGVPVGSIVTIGGVTAIALSLAAQSFVRDFVTGFLVLFEDHYVVGDYIGINTYNGLVERLTLRMVQLRDVSGDLVTISHSSVTSVVNMSRDWSRVDYRVPVDPAANVAQALALVRTAIESLASEDDWRDAFDLPIEWIGLDGAGVRAAIKPAPLRQFDVRREINARVQSAFARDGIGYGAPPPPAVLP